jgi:PAS domain S-box-containing protein
MAQIDDASRMLPGDLAAIVESSQDAIFRKSLDGVIQSWNAGAESMYGYRPEEIIGQPVSTLAPPDRRDEITHILERIGRGERVEHFSTKRVTKDGRTIDVSLSISPVRDDTGRIVGAATIARDITHVTEDRKREEGQRFLARATKELVSSLDYEATLSRIAQMAVPELADWCAVDILEPDGSLELLAVAHTDPSQVRWAREFRRAFPVDMSALTGLARVIRTGESELYLSVDAALLEASVDREQLDVIRNLQLSSVMLVPLQARGRTLGTISFVFAESGRSYGQADLKLAEDLASRAALALDNARLYRERDEIARTLQEALLPGPVPEVPGVELAARYQAAGEGIDVGGDFYDAFDTEDGAWALVVGDVCGKGPKAAALMGAARHTIRAAALRDHRPSAVLTMLNAALLQQSPEQWFCTVCYVRLRPLPGGARLTVSAGGHPLPAILRADGTVEFAGTPGTLLGVFPDIELTDATVDLRADDALVLFTDGLTDAERTTGEPDKKWLASMLARNAGRSAEEIAARLEREALRVRAEGLSDDLAILVAKVES